MALGASTTKSARNRDATPPAQGGVRDGSIVALIAYAAARMATAYTGDAEAGEMAGAAAEEGANILMPVLMGFGAGVVTLVRKRLQNRFAN